MYKGFEDLEVWKLSMELSVQVFKFISAHFNRYHPLVDQITRSAISVPSNIAEGHERGTNPDFKRFLHISKGSNAELKTQLILLTNILPSDHKLEIDEMIKKSDSISKMLYRLIQTLK
ncbi:MAG: four helix bundle protein [bacterium]|nr:four helix bundle protein [bacterium]